MTASLLFGTLACDCVSVAYTSAHVARITSRTYVLGSLSHAGHVCRTELRSDPVKKKSNAVDSESAFEKRGEISLPKQALIVLQLGDCLHRRRHLRWAYDWSPYDAA